jgi:hypothetical protein
MTISKPFKIAPGYDKRDWPIVSEGLVRYTVVGTCVQVSEGSMKK